MGIYKEGVESGPVIGQSINYTNRDLGDEHHEPVQLVLPFTPPLEKKIKDDLALDELYHNFELVLRNKNSAQADKRQIVVTLLNNYKYGAPESSLRAYALLVRLYEI